MITLDLLLLITVLLLKQLSHCNAGSYCLMNHFEFHWLLYKPLVAVVIVTEIITPNSVGLMISGMLMGYGNCYQFS